MSNRDYTGKGVSIKFSGKGADFNKPKVKSLAFVCMKNFLQDLKKDRGKDMNFEKDYTNVWGQLVPSLTSVQFDLI